MVRHCQVCKYSSYRDANLSFHRFPRNPGLRKQWLLLLGLDENKRLPDSAAVCMKHFTESDFSIKPSGLRVLKTGRLPLPIHPADTAPDDIREKSSTEKYKMTSTYQGSDLNIFDDLPRKSVKTESQTGVDPLDISSFEGTENIEPSPENSRESHIESSDLILNNSSSSTLTASETGDVVCLSSSSSTLSASETEEQMLCLVNDKLTRQSLPGVLTGTGSNFRDETALASVPNKSYTVQVPQSTQGANEAICTIMVGNNFKCRTCLDVIGAQPCYFLSIMGHPSKTIKQMIMFCVPQMQASNLSDEDVVCLKCLGALEACVRFIESCLEVEKKLNNPNRDDENSIKCVDISNDNVDVDVSDNVDTSNNVTDTNQYANMDYDYVVKKELDIDDPLDSQHVDIEGNISDDEMSDQDCIISDNGTFGSAIGELNAQTSVEEGITPAEEVMQGAKDIGEHNSTENHSEKNNSIGSAVPIPKINYQNKFRCKKFFLDDEPVLTCPFCDDKVIISQMEAHLKEHNREKTKIEIKHIKEPKIRLYTKRCFKCKLCLERFTSDEDLKVHIAEHPPLICDQCGKKCITISSLKIHKRRSHNDADMADSCLCEVCGKSYKNIKKLNFHSQIHKNMSFMCDKCPKIFKTKFRLGMHLRYVHTSGHTGQCSQCGIVLKNRLSLKSHYRLVHLKLKPFKCKICDKIFGRADYLRTHVKTHSGEPPDKDPNKDPYKYSNRNRGKRRIRWKKLTDSNQDLLPCKFCGKKFQGLLKLKWHLETHIRRYKCQYCDLTFAHKQNVKRHEVIHDEPENFFRCNICWKRTSTEEELDEHIETKHNNPKYQCPVCEEMFHTNFLLNHHNLIEHSIAGSNEKMDDIIFESLLEVAGTNET